MKTYLHGEVAIFEAKEIPSNAKAVKFNGVYKLADSESTGNHHLLEADVDSVEIVEKDGVLFLTVKAEATVKCVHEDRHDTITIPKGIYEIDIQQEYDYFEHRERDVRD